MRSGNTFVINIGSTIPDFKGVMNTGEENFPADKVFDFDEWRNNDVYMKVVKEDENVSLTGDKGNYIMSPKFSLFILAKF